jgi:hypothetical protein
MATAEHDCARVARLTEALASFLMIETESPEAADIRRRVLGLAPSFADDRHLFDEVLHSLAKDAARER